LPPSCETRRVHTLSAYSPAGAETISITLRMPARSSPARPDRSSDDDAESCRALGRQDDNGVRVRIETFATREAAVARQEEFEARHHQQIYRVERG
jgi:hypothetical protein